MKTYLTILLMALLFSFNIYSKELATFAGGCFWCMEAPFEKLKGVDSVISGFSGGNSPNPTYKKVASGQTSYLEVVQISYDPKKISYQTLLKTFWLNVDPTDAGGQFVDRGYQYTTAIFFHNEKQREIAKRSKRFLKDNNKLTKKIITPITYFC